MDSESNIVGSKTHAMELESYVIKSGTKVEESRTRAMKPEYQILEPRGIFNSESEM